MDDYSFPLRYIHLELSTKCTLKCPRCPRTEFEGMYHVGEMSLDLVKKIFKEIGNKVEFIHICGGQGDPIYNTKFLDIIKYLKTLSSKPYITIVTNGSYKSEEWWNELSSIVNKKDTIVFSVDGWDNKSNNQYRVGSDFDSIIRGVKIMAESSACVRWSTILFRFNQEKIEDIKLLAKSLGVDFFDITKSSVFGSNFPSYIDPKLGYDILEPDQKFISTYGTRFGKYKTKLSSSLFFRPPYKSLFDSKRNKYKDNFIVPICQCFGSLYIDVQGNLFPCSWVSHPFKTKRAMYSRRLISWDENIWNKNRENLDLNNYTVKEIFESSRWKELEKSWKNIDTSFIVCENKCLNNNVEYLKVHRNNWKIDKGVPNDK